MSNATCSQRPVISNNLLKFLNGHVYSNLAWGGGKYHTTQKHPKTPANKRLRRFWVIVEKFMILTGNEQRKTGLKGESVSFKV